MERPKDHAQIGSKEGQRHFIAGMVQLGKKPCEIARDLNQAFGAQALSQAQVYAHCKAFREGATGCGDAPRSGRPRTSTDNNSKEIVRDYLCAKPSATVREVEEVCGISIASVSRILKEINWSRVCAKWVPRELTMEHKRQRVQCATENLQVWRQVGDEEFRRLLITMDETQLPMFNPLTKQQSMQWGPRGRQPHTKPMKSAWTRNIMCTVWFDACGVLMVDYLPEKTTINSAYLQDQLARLREILLKKRRIMRARPFILWDNARPHVAAATTRKVEELGFRLLNHPPYSPDLAIADFHLFGAMKKPMRGRVFTSREEVTEAANESLRSLPASFWEEGVNKLLHRYEKCIQLNGDFVERAEIDEGTDEETDC
jgi:histone-lysine N-methyltransferase SETMAR